MKEIKKYVEGCDVCQRNKNHTEALAGKLMPNTVPEKLLGNHSKAITFKLIDSIRS